MESYDFEVATTYNGLLQSLDVSVFKALKKNEDSYCMQDLEKQDQH